MQTSTILLSLLAVIVTLTIPQVTFTIATLYFIFRCARAFWTWLRVLVVPLSVQMLAFEVIDAAESEEDFDDDEVKKLVKIPGAEGKTARRTRYLPIVIRSLKAELGLLKDNAANRMVLRKKIYNHATEYGLRPTHIQSIMEIAIQAILLPSDNDILAAQLRNTNAFKSRWAEFLNWGGRIASQ